jgi:hypothetical protein
MLIIAAFGALLVMYGLICREKTADNWRKAEEAFEKNRMH